MAWITVSTATRLLTIETITDSNVETAISLAEDTVKPCLLVFVSTTVMDTWVSEATTPQVVKLLTEYKAKEYILTYYYEHLSENDERVYDIEYWQKQYDSLKSEIESGNVSIITSDGTNYNINDVVVYDNTETTDFENLYD